jgi:hypothetical protein
LYFSSKTVTSSAPPWTPSQYSSMPTQTRCPVSSFRKFFLVNSGKCWDSIKNRLHRFHFLFSLPFEINVIRRYTHVHARRMGCTYIHTLESVFLINNSANSLKNAHLLLCLRKCMRWRLSLWSIFIWNFRYPKHKRLSLPVQLFYWSVTQAFRLGVSFLSLSVLILHPFFQVWNLTVMWHDTGLHSYAARIMADAAKNFIQRLT